MTVMYQQPNDNPSLNTLWFDVRGSDKLDEATAKRLVARAEAAVKVKVAILFMAKLDD